MRGFLLTFLVGGVLQTHFVASFLVGVAHRFKENDYMDRVFTGRRIISSGVGEVTQENVVSVLRSALPVHELNKRDISYLLNYYKGVQPILHRVKKVREDINNKVVQNHAYEIVQFKLGQLFSDPVQYVRRAVVKSQTEGVEQEKQATDIQVFNEYFHMANKAYVDKVVGELGLISGTAYKGIYPTGDKDEPFMLVPLDPMTTFVVYSSRLDRKPLMGVQISKDEKGNEVYCVYTPTEYFEIRGEEIIEHLPHGIGSIPVIEYPTNSLRMGAFEMVLPLLDAINKIVSDRLNGIEQFIQALVKFINCEVDEQTYQDIKEHMAINVNSRDGLPADVQIMSQELNQTQIQLLMEDLYQQVLIIVGVPNRNAPSTTSGDTGHAVIMRDGWADADTRAKDTISMFEVSERELIKIALRILKDYTDISLTVKDVGVKFSRNKNENMLVKTQGLINQLQAGINPSIAIATCGLYSDPEQVTMDSKPYLERKWGNETEAGMATGGYETRKLHDEVNTLGAKWHRENELQRVDELIKSNE